MKYAELRKKHNDLEQEVFFALEAEILESQIQSKFYNLPVIKVNIFDYVELTMMHIGAWQVDSDGHTLTFIDNNGQQYELYAECCLEDLVDILSKI